MARRAGHQGKGYATEAARVLLAHARDRGVATVEAVILPSNLPSQSVAVRIGMRRTGMVDHGGLPHDLWRWAPAAAPRPGPPVSGDRAAAGGAADGGGTTATPTVPPRARRTRYGLGMRLRNVLPPPRS